MHPSPDLQRLLVSLRQKLIMHPASGRLELCAPVISIVPWKLMSFWAMLVSVVRKPLKANTIYMARSRISIEDRNPHEIVFSGWKSSAGLRVESYGTGTQVRLPGRTAMGK